MGVEANRGFVLVRKPPIDQSRATKTEQANHREVENNWPVEVVEMEDRVSRNACVGAQN